MEQYTSGQLSTVRRFYHLLSAWFVMNMFIYDKGSAALLGFRADRIIFLILIVYFLLSAARRRTVVAKLEKTEIYMLLFSLTCTISLIMAKAGADPNHPKFYWMNVLANMTFFPFICYFIVKNMPYEKNAVKGLLLAFSIAGLYLSLTGVFEHYGASAFIFPKRIMDPNQGIHWGRVRGPFLDSVAMGRMLMISFLCTVLILTEYNDGRRSILFLCALLSVASIYFTETRGPWVGLGGAILVLLFHRTNIRKPAVVFTLLIMAGVVFGIGSKLSLSKGSLFSQRQDTVDYRVITWLISVKMTADKPIFGIGFGKFNSEWDEYFWKQRNLNLTWFDGSHNTFTTILAETGIVGLGFYIAILLSATQMLIRLYRIIDEQMKFEKALTAMVLAMELMYLVTGFFSDLKWTMLVNNIMFCFLGIAKSLELKCKANPGSEILVAENWLARES